MLYPYGVGGFLFQIHDSIFFLLFQNKINHFVEFWRFKITVVPSIIHVSLKKINPFQKWWCTEIISGNILKKKSFLKMMVYRNHFWKYFGKKNHFSKWSIFSVLMQFGIPKDLSHCWFRSRMTVIGKKLSVAWMDWYIIVFSSRCFNSRSISCRSTKWNMLGRNVLGSTLTL